MGIRQGSVHSELISAKLFLALLPAVCPADICDSFINQDLRVCHITCCTFRIHHDPAHGTSGWLCFLWFGVQMGNNVREMEMDQWA